MSKGKANAEFLKQILGEELYEDIRERVRGMADETLKGLLDGLIEKEVESLLDDKQAFKRITGVGSVRELVGQEIREAAKQQARVLAAKTVTLKKPVLHIDVNLKDMIEGKEPKEDEGRSDNSGGEE